MSITFNQLKKLITKKEIDTVLVCVSDMQGRLNGKRVTGKAFIDYVYKETHMCDYLYTVDMDMFFQYIACGTGDVSDDGAFLASQCIQQRRFTSVRAPSDHYVHAFTKNGTLICLAQHLL